MEADRTEMHDLSAQYPEVVARLAAAWDEWAKRANVLPLGAWRAESKNTFSSKTQFVLAPGAQLPRTEAPYVVGKG